MKKIHIPIVKNSLMTLHITISIYIMIRVESLVIQINICALHNFSFKDNYSKSIKKSNNIVSKMQRYRSNHKHNVIIVILTLTIVRITQYKNVKIR